MTIDEKIRIQIYEPSKNFFDELYDALNFLKQEKLGTFDANIFKKLIRSELLRVAMNNHKNVGKEDIAVLIGSGSASKCFRSVNGREQKYIYKLFCPNDLPLETVVVADSQAQFYWLSNNAMESDCESFLRRFIRFVTQSLSINQIIESSNLLMENLLTKPELFLSSQGLVWRINVLFGDTIEEELRSKIENPEPQDILKRIELVLDLSKSIKTYFHEKGIFHGDIKPENFLIVGFENGSQIVRNIDFDTCFDEKQLASGQVQHLLATTRRYYSAPTLKDIINNSYKDIRNQMDELFSLDVKALAKVLMRALDLDCSDFFEVVRKKRADNFDGYWAYEFCQSDSFQKVFDILEKNNENKAQYNRLSTLYITNKLSNFLRYCAGNCKPEQEIATIDKFIKELQNIYDLIAVVICGQSYKALTEDLLKCFSLNQLQQQSQRLTYGFNHITNRCFRVNESVEDILSGIFCEECSFGRKGINKQLLPQIISVKSLKLEMQQEVKEKSGVVDNGDEYSCGELKEGNHLEPCALSNNTVNYGRRQTLNQLLENKDNTNVFISAKGGAGKSTTLYTFWLDYLCGNHEMSCVYADLKLLSPNESRPLQAIHDYIQSSYRIDLNKVENHNEIILLLDGANEAAYCLREEIDGIDSQIAVECRNLMSIGLGYRVVISNRTNHIGIPSNYPSKCAKNLIENKEFDENSTLYCELCELTDAQLSKVIPNKDKSTTLYKMLKNNMMLSIYANLEDYDKKLVKENITGGELLQLYFEVCFKVRYIKNATHRTYCEKELYEIITKKPILNNRIKEASSDYDRIYTWLMTKSTEREIMIEENDDVRAETIEHLGVLSHRNNRYYWVNEIYQEYFWACKIKSDFLQMEYHYNYCKEWSSLVYGIDRASYYAWFDMSEFSVKLIQDLAKFDQERLDKISLFYKNYLQIESVTSPVVYILLKLAILHGFNIPKGLTYIPTMSYYEQKITKLIIPDNIRILNINAFRHCEIDCLEINSNEIEIEEGAFAYSRIENIKFNCKEINFKTPTFRDIKGLTDVEIQCPIRCVEGTTFAPKGLFYKCSSLRKIVLSNIENVDSKLLGKLFQDCQLLEEVYISGNIVESDIRHITFRNCPSLKVLVINNKKITQMEKVQMGDVTATFVKLESIG